MDAQPHDVDLPCNTFFRQAHEIATCSRNRGNQQFNAAGVGHVA